jgi:hypothetical protein
VSTSVRRSFRRFPTRRQGIARCSSSFKRNGRLTFSSRSFTFGRRFNKRSRRSIRRSPRRGSHARSRFPGDDTCRPRRHLQTATWFGWDVGRPPGSVGEAVELVGIVGAKDVQTRMFRSLEVLQALVVVLHAGRVPRCGLPAGSPRCFPTGPGRRAFRTPTARPQAAQFGHQRSAQESVERQALTHPRRRRGRRYGQ